MSSSANGDTAAANGVAGTENHPLQIYSNGIYHGLPLLPSSAQGLTAIVTGANGISGAHMIRVLGSNPKRWKKVYAISRRPPSGDWPENTEHIACDFLKSPEEIAGVLKENLRGQRVDYVFFFSYVLVTDEDGALQWGDQRLVDQNNLLLTNFLHSLPLANALPQRIFLQFGQKYHGVHLGATNIPDLESDPRLTLEPNLYYTQHDILASFCAAQTPEVGWNTAYPSFVIGAALDSSQSLMFPILVYAAVQKYLGRKLEYPSTLEAWYAPQSLSNAVLNSYSYEWAVLNPHTANQAFNTSDDSLFTWGKFWPRLASYFDIPWTGPETDQTFEWREKRLKAAPPPHGWGKEPSVLKFEFDFVEWANREDNRAAWAELAAAHGLREGEWRDVGSVFGRANFCLHRPFPSVLSANKAKKFGFFGHVDSEESILSVADEFVALKILPDPKLIVPKTSSA